MGFGLVIVGSEILSGKRRDAHMGFVIEALDRRGLELGWCHFVIDDPAALTALLRHTMSTEDVVLCFGGIGATPDDHTRQAAGNAAGVPLLRHPQAAAEIEQRFGAGAHPQRIRMADLPEGARLIPNPVNRVPGFSLCRHHFVPGFPQMGWPMCEWVLDTEYAHLRPARPRVETLLLLPGTSEGVVVELLERFVARFPRLRLACLPHFEGEYRETELGVRGEAAEVSVAVDWLIEALERDGISWRHSGGTPTRTTSE